MTAAIAKDLSGDALNVVVGTHQHNDHLSGFVHCEKTFRKMNIDQVWLSWLDNPADRKARAVGNAHTSLLVALQSARANLRAAMSGPGSARPLASRRSSDPPRMAIAVSSAACRSRWTIWVLTWSA